MLKLFRTFGFVCFTGLVVAALFPVTISSAYAACANPSAEVGEIIYNAPAKAFQGCTRGGWKAFHAVAAPDPCSQSPVTGTVCTDGSVYVGVTPDGNHPMFTTPGDSPTRMAWDNSPSPADTTMQNCGSGASCRTGLANTIFLASLSATPDPFQAAKYCSDLNAHGKTDWYLPARDELTLIYDNKAAIGGVTETSWHWSSSEYDANTAHYRFMASGGAGQGGKPTNGWVRCVRQQDADGGGVQDDTPDAFSFAALTDQALNSQITSNTITLTGIGPAPVLVSVTGAGTPQININNEGWVTSGTISAGQTLQLRLTSANATTTLRSATVTVGATSQQWDVTTSAADTTPDSFAFTDVIGQMLNTLVTSNTVTITGLGPGSVYTQASGSGNPQININGGGWVASGFISNGQTLQVRMTSAPTVASAYPVVVLVGTLNSTWTVTTAVSDHTPDPFNFTDLTGQARSTLVTSNTLTITGLGPEDVAVNASGDGSPQISINGGGWVTSGTIRNNQTLQARLTTSGSGSVVFVGAIVVGSVQDLWNVTTAAALTAGQFAYDENYAPTGRYTNNSGQTVTVTRAYDTSGYLPFNLRINGSTVASGTYDTGAVSFSWPAGTLLEMETLPGWDNAWCSCYDSGTASYITISNGPTLYVGY